MTTALEVDHLGTESGEDAYFECITSRFGT